MTQAMKWEAARGSRSDEWETPNDLFEALDREFLFTVDVCATEGNAKLPRFWDPVADGLAQSWAGERCWMNPPYGRGTIDRWMAAALRESRQKATVVVALVFARTDAVWWHQYAMRARELRFIRGRLMFSGVKRNAPSASVVVVFDRHSHGPPVVRSMRRTGGQWKTI